LRRGVRGPQLRREVGCSRLSTAGSIAAVIIRADSTRAPGCAPASQRRAPLRLVDRLDGGGLARGCSRLSTAGSIAACRAAASPASARSSAPASQRRAPLRPGARRGQPRRGQVLPPLNGGLHCGSVSGLSAGMNPVPCSRLSTAGSIAAVRLGGFRIGHRLVLPPLNGGLHCGCRVRLALDLADQPCSRLSTAGSIAALHTTADGASGSAVLPPLNGGLHCGCGAPIDKPAEGHVLPPLNGGLHCGSVACIRISSSSGVCSRLSTAGSIAAASPASA